MDGLANAAADGASAAETPRLRQPLPQDAPIAWKLTARWAAPQARRGGDTSKYSTPAALARSALAALMR